jgi:FtsP/CotA-like multicopper oxidase with cupredoxin domain
MRIDRRSLLKLAALAPMMGIARNFAWAADEQKPDYTLRIANGLIELAPKHIVSTTLYNGQFPGPLLRLKEGQRVVVDVHNDTDTPELVHWHGQMIPSDVDGAAEEGSPFVPAHGMRRISFVPRPAGFRFYHTHVVAGADLNRGTYSGQAGPVYIEPKDNPGAYDREVFLVMKEFEPSFSRGGDMAMDALVGAPIAALQQMGMAADEEAKGTPKGYEVGYELFSINGRMLGEGEPIRVKEGERVLIHVLNASATEIRSLALPGHLFRILALDGNPVPKPGEVPVLWLGTAERISAIVEMKHPASGLWATSPTTTAITAWASSSNTPARPASRAGRSRSRFTGTTRNSAKTALPRRPTRRSRWPSSSTTPPSMDSTGGHSTARPSRWRA